MATGHSESVSGGLASRGYPSSEPWQGDLFARGSQSVVQVDNVYDKASTVNVDQVDNFYDKVYIFISHQSHDNSSVPRNTDPTVSKLGHTQWVFDNRLVALKRTDSRDYMTHVT